MKNKKEPDVSGGKKPYVKPEVRKITLIAEEAILGFCKKSGGTGPATISCGAVIHCSGIGS